jgi:predicted amidophosphoribosyltransferase
MLETFVGVFCQRNHGSGRGELCGQCQELLAYATQRLARCPLEPKPKCKDCHIHCYGEPYRSRIRQVMKFSGIHFVKRGRLDWLVRYFLNR